MWSMCNAAGTPGKHFRDCEKGRNSLGGTLVSVEDQAQQRLLRHFVGEDIDLLIGAYQRTYKSPDSGWRWTSAARPDHPFTAWRRGYPADVGAHLSRNHRGTPSEALRQHRHVQDEPVRLHQLPGQQAWVDTSCVLAATAASIARRGASASARNWAACPPRTTSHTGRSSTVLIFCRPIDLLDHGATICGGTLLTFAHSIMKARRRASWSACASDPCRPSPR